MGTDPRITLQTAAILKGLLNKPLQPRYGLEIAKEAGLRSGTLYPALARLEQAGWITSFWEDIDEAVEGRRRRRYYQLTAEGIIKARRAVEAAAERVSPPWLPSPGSYPSGAQA